MENGEKTDKTDVQYVLYDKATHHKFESLRKYCIKGMGAYVFSFSTMNNLNSFLF